MNYTIIHATCHFESKDVIMLSRMYTLTPSLKTSLWISGIVNSLASLPTATLNLSVVIAIVKFKSLQINSNMLILNLAVTDFLAGCFVQPSNAVFFIYLAKGRFICISRYAAALISVSLSLLSLLTVFCIASERFLAIFHPFFYNRFVTKRKIWYLFTASWILVFTFAVAGVLHSTLSEVLTFFSLMVIIITFLWNLYVYTKIYIFVKKIRLEINAINRPTGQINSSEENFKKDKRLISFTALVVAAFFLCYMPYVICQIGQATLSDLSSKSIWANYTKVILSLNSMINPLIIYFQNPAIKEAVIKMLSRKLTEPAV